MKQSKRQSASPAAPETARLSARVSLEAYQRLFVASVMGGETAAEILDKLILAHCREWSLPGKIVARVDKSNRHESAPCVSDSDAPLPSQIAA